MKKKILNVVIYSFLFIGILSFAFLTLPEEIRASFGFLTRPVALITGVFTSIGGSFGLYLNGLLNKNRNEISGDLGKLLERLVDVEKKYDKLSEVIGKALENDNAIIKSNIKLANEIKLVDNSFKEGISLFKQTLEKRLENPFLPEDEREMIEGVINEKEKSNSL